MHSSKLTLAFSILLIVSSQLCFNRATGLPWRAKSREDESDGLVADEEAWEEELDDIIMRKVLKQGREPLDIEGAAKSGRVTEKQDSEYNSNVGLEESNTPSELQIDSQETSRTRDPQTANQRIIVAGHILTKKVLTSLKKERKRKQQDRLLLLHRLYLFQKPQKMASTTSFQDFLNYLKGVGKRIKDFFTKHPVDVTMQGEADSTPSQERITDSEEESYVQMQEVRKALIQVILFDVLESMAKK